MTYRTLHESTPSLSGQTLSHPPAGLKVREGLAAVISIHELLTNQILLFNVETVAAPWLQYVRLLFWMVQFTVAH